MSRITAENDVDISAYINAGGRGTRLSGVMPSDPSFGIAKALIDIGGTKIIDYQIARLRENGFSRIVVGAGDQQRVVNHVLEHYENDGQVTPIVSNKQFGTGGDLINAFRTFPDLFGSQVLVNNVDTILDVDEDDFINFHNAAKTDASIVLTTSKGVPNEGAFSVDSLDKVIQSTETHDST